MKVEKESIPQDRLNSLHLYWLAANYLTVGQIYLRSNPLLKEPLKPRHIKKRLLGHWGTSPGLNLIYAHLNRLIQDTEAKILYIAGPGHGGPAIRANVYLEGALTKFYDNLGLDIKGLEVLMREFSWPGGVPSHVSPPTPGSIHEGGELGYALAHAYGAVFDNPGLIAACVVGDGEAETGPLAASWLSSQFLNPERDGAVLPILHLNGYKIAGPTLFGRMTGQQVQAYFEGCGYIVKFIEGDDPYKVHQDFWHALDWAYTRIRHIQNTAGKGQNFSVPAWPMIVLRTPKGWTGPKVVDNKKVEGTFRSHQVPLSNAFENPDHRKILEEWMKSYHPENLFEENGAPKAEVLQILPKKELRMGLSPYANGGVLLKELNLPDFSKYGIPVPSPGTVKGEATRELGKFLRDIFTLNDKNKNFRIFCPDETKSNRLDHVFEVTNRMYLGNVLDSDDHLGKNGRVMEVLSEHLCQGWLEGYLLTGRHGLFPCYEAFALIVDSMMNQHAKWLKSCSEIPWRKPIASLNYLLTSHAWRQDHNGYSHQGPGFINSVLQKKSSVARIYLPPDANCLLSVADHCLRSRNYINLIIAGKQPMLQWLSMEEAKAHCTKGAGIWHWASNNKGQTPDVVMAAAGDTPTLEILAAITYLRKSFPEIKIQMVNIVDLFILSPFDLHPHGLDDEQFFQLFPEKVPVIFGFHGHPRVIHELVYKRDKGSRFHVRGYIEEGTTTTPFDMVVCNEMSRFHLVIETLRRMPHLKTKSADLIDECQRKLMLHKAYIQEHGEDLPEIQHWQWEA
ncbi:MAG: phosphoketolase family protein [Simkaniaceae bacterium]